MRTDDRTITQNLATIYNRLYDRWSRTPANSEARAKWTEVKIQFANLNEAIRLAQLTEKWVE